MAQIVLDRVDKMFPGGTKAVDGLSLDIPDGEFVVLVGPSGCGKTTVLRMIAGLEQATHGTIRIGDRVMNHVAPKDRDIAMVFQNYALYPSMTVRENLAFGLRMRKTSKPEINRRVRDAAGVLGLEEYLERKPAALSGGQRQRVAMGRAIVREPEVFLMDEPLSNLDAKLRVSMRTSLAEMHERLNVTTVYVTHDQVEAMTLGDRVCVLRGGVLQQVDTPKNLFDRPVNLFVGGFIGSPSMNIVAAKLVKDDGRPAVTFAGYKLAIAEDVVHTRPEIEAYFGREVVLGIRPSDFEEASLVDESWARMPVTTHVTEELGSEIHVIFVVDAPPVEHKDVADLVPVAEEGEAAAPLYKGKSVWTARVDAHSEARAGDPIELGVDTRNLYFFDPGSGLAIGQRQAPGPRPARRGTRAAALQGQR